MVNERTWMVLDARLASLDDNMKKLRVAITETSIENIKKEIKNIGKNALELEAIRRSL